MDQARNIRKAAEEEIRGFMRLPNRVKRIIETVFKALNEWGAQAWGIGKAAEEITSNQSLDIDLGILHWTIGALGGDDTIEKFFDAIPGFFNSEVVQTGKIDSRSGLASDIQRALDGFLNRTLSSNPVIESVKNRRLDLCLNAVNVMYGPHDVCAIPSHLLIPDIGPWSFGQLRPGQKLWSIETAHTLTPVVHCQRRRYCPGLTIRGC